MFTLSNLLIRADSLTFVVISGVLDQLAVVVIIAERALGGVGIVELEQHSHADVTVADIVDAFGVVALDPDNA